MSGFQQLVKPRTQVSPACAQSWSVWQPPVLPPELEPDELELDALELELDELELDELELDEQELEAPVLEELVLEEPVDPPLDVAFVPDEPDVPDELDDPLDAVPLLLTVVEPVDDDVELLPEPVDALELAVELAVDVLPLAPLVPDDGRPGATRH
jgi:hypothetical protein